MTLNYTLEPNHSSIKTLVYFPVRNGEPKTVGGFFYLAYDSCSTQNPDAKVPIPGISEGPRRSSKELQYFKLALAKHQNIFICVCVCIDSPLNVAQIPFPTTEVQHRKGSVSIYINFFQQTCLKKNLPQRKILSIHPTDVFTTVTMIKVTTREASV